MLSRSPHLLGRSVNRFTAALLILGGAVLFFGGTAIMLVPYLAWGMG